MKNGKYVCFFISPIGAEGSEINERANDVYELIVQPAFLQCGVDVYRGDENASSNHIGVDVIGCIREADLCIADISYLNCNVYYELGLADAMAKPVILLKEATVDAASLPADVGSRKYLSYSVEGKQRRAAKQNLIDFVNSYIKELDAKPSDNHAAGAQPAQTQQLLDEIYALRRQLEEKQASGPAQVNLPMDLRPKQLLPMEEAQKREITTQLEKLLSGKQAQIAAASDQIVALLHRLRSVIGDAEYLRVWLMRRSYMAPCIWNECLQCAAAWLDVDMAHTALDLTWLQPLLDGLEHNYDTPDQWPTLENIFDRIYAISNGYDDYSGNDVIFLDANGVPRQYRRDEASYYRGMLAYYKHLRTQKRICLDEASSYLTSRIVPSDNTQMREARRAGRRVDAFLLLAEAYIRCNRKLACADAVKDALAMLSKAQFSTAKQQYTLYNAYYLSLCCDLTLAEEIAERMRTETPESADRKMKLGMQESLRLEAELLIRDMASKLVMTPSFLDRCLKLFPKMRREQLVLTENNTASSAELDGFMNRIQQLLNGHEKPDQVITLLQSLQKGLVKLKSNLHTQIQNDVLTLIKQYLSENNVDDDLSQQLLDNVLWSGSDIDVDKGKERLAVIRDIVANAELRPSEKALLEQIISAGSRIINAYEAMDEEIIAQLLKI